MQIREDYRHLFGIETRCRQMNPARIRTCTRNPLLRLLYVEIALILVNVWVWLHNTFFAERGGLAPWVDDPIEVRTPTTFHNQVQPSWG